MSDRTQVNLLLDMLDSAYQRPIPANWTDGWHSMLSNLQHVRDEDWDWLPPDGKRSIKRIVAHTAGVLLMYTDYGFGPGTMQWSEVVPTRGKDTTRADFMQWFTENMQSLRDALSACTDDRLDKPLEYWDPGERPRSWFATTMIEHILYHAGEINHIRALAQKNDARAAAGYPLPMSRAAVDQLLYLLDRAFVKPEGDDPEHAFLKNLAPVSDDDFPRAAPNGGRTIIQIAWHVAACKFMYANHGFEDGKMDWPELFNHWEGSPTKSEMIDWLNEAHAYFRRHVEPLDDSELAVLRKAPFGVEFETRWLIANMVEHDLYHSGEINLIRGLLQGTDAWPKYDE